MCKLATIKRWFRTPYQNEQVSAVSKMEDTRKEARLELEKAIRDLSEARNPKGHHDAV